MKKLLIMALVALSYAAPALAEGKGASFAEISKPLPYVIVEIAYKGGLNVLVSRDVPGYPVSIGLTNANPMAALAVLAQTYDLVVRNEHGILVVSPAHPGSAVPPAAACHCDK